MPASFELIGPRWADNSPLWSASIRITEELQRRSARLVYGSTKSSNFPLPGTMLVHAQIDSIKVNLGTNLQSEFKATSVVQSSFLVAADPNEWDLGLAKISRMVCLEGQFPCEPFFGADLARLPADFRRRIELAFPQGLSLLQASSSGFLFEGKAKMPDTVAFANKLPIRLELAKPQSNQPGLGDFIFLLDRDRLAEEQFADGMHELLIYFRKLVKIRLNPSSQDQSRLKWIRLELADLDRVPEFHWRVDIARPNETDVRFPEGAWKLYISDQDLEEVQTPPRGVLTATPSVVLSRDSLSVSGGKNLPVPNGTAEYAWSAADGAETWSLHNVAFQYNPIEVARSLRAIYNLPTPRLDDFDKESITDNSRLIGVLPNSDGKVDPAVLWGFMPLGDGWAQLPFLNCTEQILVDALPPLVEPTPPSSIQQLESQFRGAAVFGNDRSELYNRQSGQAPWNLAILDAASFAGKWSFNADRSLGAVTLSLFSPELTSEGMLCIASAPPTAQDALPSVDDWIGGTIPIGLKTPQTKLVQIAGQTVQENAELYPSPFLIAIHHLSFKAHKLPSLPNRPAFELAQLENFRWSYQVNDFTHLGTVPKSQLGLAHTQESVSVRLPYSVWLLTLARSPFKHEAFWGASAAATVASARSALAWRRHPTCPAVQNLPLTQNNVPANHLSPSRSLFPFQFALEKTTGTSLVPFAYFKPKNWEFSWNAEHKCFETVSTLLRPASELDHNVRLALVPLGLPGFALALASNQPGRDLLDPSGFLPRLIIRHDLPLLDQPNALADVPAEKEATDSPPPPPPALDRQSLAAHFRKLENKAVLSEVDEAESVFRVTDNQVEVTGLVEPHVWPARLNVSLDGFPATASLTDMISGHAVEWAGETEGKDALRGVHGAFDLDGKLKLKTDGKFELVAGSMSTVSERLGGQPGLRDQRGLVRTAAKVKDAFIISTITQIQSGANKHWMLVTCQSPLQFTVDERVDDDDPSKRRRWNLWFRGLPMQPEGTGQLVFERKRTISKSYRGVNDPEADGRDLGPLNDYQWRLGLGKAVTHNWLPLGDLRFFPLALDRVELNADGSLKSSEIVGRLELPCLGPDGNLSDGEFTQYDSAVVLTITGGTLDKIRCAPLDEDPERSAANANNQPAKIWPLTDADSPFDRPLLVWKNIEVVKAGGMPQAIRIPAGDAELQYTRSGLAWKATSQASCDFSLTSTSTGRQEIGFAIPVQPAADIGVNGLQLILDAVTGQHELTAKWFFHLGNTTRLQINGAYEDYILGPGASNITAQLVHAGRSIDLCITPARVSLDDFGFSFSWEKFGRAEDWAAPVDPTGWQLLPGMHLAPPEQQPCRGAAMVAFQRKSGQSSFPQFELTGAYFDILFNCFWGQSLQDVGVPERPLNPESVFGSSAGRIQAEYHSALNKSASAVDAWPFEMSLSGLLEIKNVYSWPANLVLGDQGKVTVPTRNDQPGNHWRHTARLLLSEFRVSSIDPVVNQEPIIVGSHKDDVILTIQPGRIWNVPAQVEHQLIRIQSADGQTFVDTKQELRWTAVQQVRFASPRAFYNQLVEIKDKVALDSVTTHGGQLDRWSFKASFDVLYGMNSRIILRTMNIMDGVNRILPFEQTKLNDLEDCLVIDGTFPFFIKREPQQANDIPGTHLQAVFSGSIRANSVVRSDFAIKNTTLHVSTDQLGHNNAVIAGSSQNPAQVATAGSGALAASAAGGAAQGWLFVQLPFMGRLQSQERASQSPNKLLSRDPVVELMATPAQSPPSVWLHAVTSRAINQSVTVQYSQIDRARLRTIQRLDPSSLDEAWLRLHLIREQSRAFDVLNLPRLTTSAATSDSLVATARHENVHRLFEPRRQDNPPRRLPPNALPKPSATSFEWTPQSIALWNAKIQSDANLNLDNDRPFAFLPWIIYLKDAGLLELAEKKRYMAATLIPAADVEPDTLFHSVSIAVSSFTGISYAEMSPKRTPLLRTVELLVFDASRSRIEKAGEQIFHDRSDDLLAWSQSIIRSHAFDTPAAILRIRDLNEIGNQQAVEIVHQFLEVPYETEAVELRRQTLPMQSIPEQRRFAQSQYGGNDILETSAFQVLELAPPAVQGCQPIRQLERPVPALPTPAAVAVDWPWGLSAMRLTTAYRQRKSQALGTIGASPSTVQEAWWQACSIRVQFEVAKDRTLLPDAHRTAAIPGFLPTWPVAPMPKVTDVSQALGGKPAAPVLPGRRRILATGLRAGAPYAFRESIVTQRVKDALVHDMTTSSLPVQHRAPRPVLLPGAKTNRQDIALQTWGSWFDLSEGAVGSRTLSVSRHPQAEYLVAKADGTALGLHVTMTQPSAQDIEASNLPEAKKKELQDVITGFPSEGVLPRNWNGLLYLNEQQRPAGAALNPKRTLTCIIGEQTIQYVNLESSTQFWVPAKQTPQDVVAKVQNLPAGSLVQWRLSIELGGSKIGGYMQVATLLTRLDDRTFASSLAPRFLTWEDPEYNRRLTSLTARKEFQLKTNAGEMLVFALVADRREFNATSKINYAVVSTGELSPAQIASLPLFHFTFQVVGKGKADPDKRVSGAYSTIPGETNLAELASSQLKPGDIVRLEAHFGANVPIPPSLDLAIVSLPVTPVPESAYAILRRLDGHDTCVRFGWGIEPTTSELLDPDDLRTQIVRRRAIFTAVDSINRSQPAPTYAIQKTTAHGATHFPKIDVADR